MANQWFRMYAEFASDPKVQMMSEAMQRRLVMLFCMRCCDVTVTLSDEEIAFQLRISDEELASTKDLFMRRGFIDSDWNIVNWEKRQYASDSSAERTRAYRKRLRDAAVTSQPSQSDALEQNRTEQNRTDLAQPDSEPKRSPAGSRLPAGWQLPAAWRTWAISERPDVDPDHQASIFADHWHSKPGKDGRKTDWQATWRNWIRRVHGPPNGRPILRPADESPAASRRL